MFLVSCYQSDQFHTLWFGMYQQESRENIFHDCLVFQRREVNTFLELTKLVYSSFFMAATWDLEILHDDNLHCALHFRNVKVMFYEKGIGVRFVIWSALFFIAPLNLKERPLCLEFSCCDFVFFYKYINERGKILSIWVPHTVREICLPSTIYVCKANVKLYLKSALSNSSMHKLYDVSIRPFLFPQLSTESEPFSFQHPEVAYRPGFNPEKHNVLLKWWCACF